MAEVVGALRAQVAQLTADRAALQAENARLRAHNEALATMVRGGGVGVGGVVGQQAANRRLAGVGVALAAADTAVTEFEVHPQPPPSTPAL